MASSGQPELPLIDLIKFGTQEALAAQPIQVGNFPGNQPVTVTNFPGTQNVAVGPNNSATVSSRATGISTPPNNTTAAALTPTTNLVQGVFVLGMRSDGGFNTGIVFYGTSSGQSIPIWPGAAFSEMAAPGKKIDLNQIFLRVGTVGDGLVWISIN
jgi:hypothetical protein